MKNIEFNTILQQIGGEIIHGSGNPIIQHVINYPKKEIYDHSLVFHMDKEKIRGKYWNHHEAVVIVTDKPDLCTNLGEQIIVVKTEDIEKAYWRFINYYRGLFDIPVIGVTGTCGKTTTKEMMKQILVEDYKVKATWRSMNSMSVNLRYLTGIDDETEVAVFEMPVAYPGYLKVACCYFQPQIRILLNIGVHHLTGSKTPEAYMKAKGEIVDGLDEEHGILILNADDENIRKVVDSSKFKRVIYFGKSDGSHFRAKNIQYANGGMNFTLEHGGELYEAFVPGYGEHNVYNALAAIAAVSFVDIDIPTAIKRLGVFKQVKQHLEFKKGVNGCSVIDDTWNSSPLSMSTGIEVLKDVSKGKKSIALLGYMPQLGKGKHASRQYEDMGKKAAEAKIDSLIVVGERAEEIGKAAAKYGMDKENIHFCTTGEEVYDTLKPDLQENTVILLKVTHRVMKQTSFKQLREKLIVDNDK
ncbi:Mur ligase family protein [Bacillus seohaeanensis]|uniref:Mur ligase family protein n=1 Tax=Bacillus seohaeanensis TaxID=284580 RepID=A0ABW5RLP1_9BACI